MHMHTSYAKVIHRPLLSRANPFEGEDYCDDVLSVKSANKIYHKQMWGHLLRGRPVWHTPLESPGTPSWDWQMLTGDNDFEKSPHSLNFSSEVWKVILCAGKKGGKLFSLISWLFCSDPPSLEVNPGLPRSPFWGQVWFWEGRCQPCGPVISPEMASSMRVWEKKMLVGQSCPTLCNPTDCNPPGSSVHGILQARILEWAAISFSRESSQPRDWTSLSCIGRQILYCWTTREAPELVIIWALYLLLPPDICGWPEGTVFLAVPQVRRHSLRSRDLSKILWPQWILRLLLESRPPKCHMWSCGSMLPCLYWISS